MIPVIGITTFRGFTQTGAPSLRLLEAYAQAVSRAGGAPLLIPVDLSEGQIEAIWPRLDGMVLSGGSDIAPALFGGMPHPAVEGVNQDRDRVEIALMRRAAQQAIPFLGICRGIQLVNVAFGGSLHTHIPDQLPGAIHHRYDSNTQRDHLAHPVRIEPDSALAKILGTTNVWTNSLHHQGISTLGQGLRPLGWTSDGLIEAVELVNHPFGLAVQWHPECLPDRPEQQALFGALVRACQSAP
jgi:putative glutamine amidotransferase